MLTSAHGIHSSQKSGRVSGIAPKHALENMQMKAKSKASAPQMDSASLTPNHWEGIQLKLPLFATAESARPNSETIAKRDAIASFSPAKSSSCEIAIPKPKSSKTSDRDSTSSEKDCNPYWSDLCAAISSRLWLPAVTDCAGFDSSCSSSWFNKTVGGSWFSTHLLIAGNPSSQPQRSGSVWSIFSPSFTSAASLKQATAAGCRGDCATAWLSRKIRIFLSPEQKALLKQWFGVSRYVCNATIKHLQEPGTKANWMAVAPIILGALPEWAFFSESSCGWIGNDANLRIQKLCFKLDRLISKISKAKSAQKRRLKKAADRIRCKVEHLVKELHHKTARFLVENFDVILLPGFESSQMAGKSRRKIKSKTVRQLLTLSHYQFKKHLEWKAWEMGKITLTDINKAYTSKTVSWTGEIVNLGGLRTIRSKIDGRVMNRDLNGERGIFLRALVDTPWLRDALNLCIC